MAMRFDTHEVVNQPPPLAGHNVFRSDVALVEALERDGAGWAGGELDDLGTRAGSIDARIWAGVRTRIRPFCSPTTATGTGSTTSGITRRTTS